MPKKIAPTDLSADLSLEVRRTKWEGANEEVSSKDGEDAVRVGGSEGAK